MAESKSNTTKQKTGAQGDANQGSANQGGNNQNATKHRVLRVSSRPHSFRRAGMTFTRREQVLYVEQLTDDQVEAIKAERRLVVTEDEIEA